MTDTENKKQILEDLKSKGFRITKARTLIVDAFSQKHSPLNANDLIDILKKEINTINKSTIYRELEFLIEQNIIKEIEIDPNKSVYEMNFKEDHHHHIQCTNCKRIDHIELNQVEKALEKESKMLDGYKITDHSVKLYGLCSDCRD